MKVFPSRRVQGLNAHYYLDPMLTRLTRRINDEDLRQWTPAGWKERAEELESRVLRLDNAATLLTANVYGVPHR